MLATVNLGSVDISVVISAHWCIFSNQLIILRLKVLFRFCFFIFSLINYKGQIILKGLFGILEFSQKTNEQIRFFCLPVL